MSQNDKLLLIIGIIFVILGFLISFLMVIGILQKSIALSILSYSLSISGLGLGYLTLYRIVRKKDRKRVE
jgi:membrane associated rhomboid family serine protease